MAKKSMIAKQKRKQKFSTREYNRCKICGRPHAYLRKYGIQPWDYSKEKYNYKGVIRLDFIPVWFFVGLLYEYLLDRQTFKNI